jgi:HK97 family phage major capsid protein
VPDIWSTELWRKARMENVILPLFRVIEMPSNPFELPISGTDPTVYYVPETQDEDDLTLTGAGNPIPDSQIGSGKVTLTAKKLALRVGFSAELAEDAAIPLIALYREQALRVMADAIDSVLLNGDIETAATGNINSDNAAPSGTAKYMAFNGLRKLALVTNTANKTDANGAPSVSLLRTARFLMDPRYSLRPKDCAYVMDGSTYAKLLSDTSLATVDKFGPHATVLTGEIGKVDGVPVLVSSEMPLTMADGKADTVGNSKGQVVCVYRPGWVVGYRRRVAATMNYLPYYDAYQMVATVRLAFVNFDNEVASVLYNITV